MPNPTVSVNGTVVTVSGSVNANDNVTIVIKDSSGNVIIDESKTYTTGGMKTENFDVTNTTGSHTVIVSFGGGSETTTITVPQTPASTFAGSLDP